MKLAVHQPNYLPWLGYFKKIARCDIFLIYDDIQFEKGGYTNRVKIRNSDSTRWLTQPLTNVPLSKRIICNLNFSNDFDWRAQHLRIIEMTYGKRPYHNKIFPVILEIFSNKTNSMAEFNYFAIKAICKFLEINTKIYCTSDLNYNRDLNATQKLISFCFDMKCNEYSSGAGAVDYNNEGDFNLAGIKLSYDDWQHPIYEQGNNFIKGLSVIDVLCNSSICEIREWL